MRERVRYPAPASSSTRRAPLPDADLAHHITLAMVVVPLPEAEAQEKDGDVPNGERRGGRDGGDGGTARHAAGGEPADATHCRSNIDREETIIGEVVSIEKRQWGVIVTHEVRAMSSGAV